MIQLLVTPLSFVEACLQLLLVARKLPGQNTPDVVSDLLGRKTVTALQESGKIGRWEQPL